MLDLSLFHIVPKAVHLEDFISLQNQVMKLILATERDGIFERSATLCWWCVAMSGLGMCMKRRQFTAEMKFSYSYKVIYVSTSCPRHLVLQEPLSFSDRCGKRRATTR